MARDSLNPNTILIIGAVGLGAYFLFKPYKDTGGGYETAGGNIFKGVGDVLELGGSTVQLGGRVIKLADEAVIQPVTTVVKEASKLVETATPYIANTTTYGQPASFFPVVGPTLGIIKTGFETFIQQKVKKEQNVSISIPQIRAVEKLAVKGFYSAIDKQYFGGILPAGYVKTSVSTKAAATTAPAAPTKQITPFISSGTKPVATKTQDIRVNNVIWKGFTKAELKKAGVIKK